MRYKCSMKLWPSKSSRLTAARHGLATTSLALLALGLTGAPSLAGGLSTAWPAGAKSRTSLLSAGAPVGGRYEAGLDVELAPGVLTYWRSPGDAGVPPVFNFTNSENVAGVSVAYPAPARIEDAGTTTYGYQGEVLFPLEVRPKDPSRPSVLDLEFHYATCDTICMPAEAHHSIRLSPGASPSADRERIERWAARVPQPLPARLAPQIAAAKGGPKPIWRASFPHSGAGTELFVEGPAGYYFDSKAEGLGRFDIALAEKPSGQSLPVVPVTLTFVDGDHAYETSVSLDAASAGR